MASGDDTTRTGAALPPPGRQLRVITTSGPLHLALPARGVITLGRGDETDLRVDDRSVSRRHAALHLGDEVHVEDLGSANGTRVRGAQVVAGQRVPLRPGDVVEFGSVLCALVGGGAPARVAAPTGVVIEDPAMQRLHALLDRVAKGSMPVLLLGETGVGKEVFAARLHARSPRSAKPYVQINCAALTDTLVESELFGHEKGAFSGAVAAKPGLLESAEGGTVFLDEVGEMPLPLQAKLLRVLEENMVRRVGALRPRPIDVRVVAATNRDLAAESAAGRFREDLYFRLCAFTLTIPPLRERRSEIAPLARHFAQAAAAQCGRSAVALTDDALGALVAHDWPGNVRELRNTLSRAVMLSSDGVIAREHLALPAPRASAPAVIAPTSAAVAPPAARDEAALPYDLRDALSVVERQRIIDALERCVGNQTRAAELLGISRRALVTKIEQYGLPRPRKREG